MVFQKKQEKINIISCKTNMSVDSFDSFKNTVDELFSENSNINNKEESKTSADDNNQLSLFINTILK